MTFIILIFFIILFIVILFALFRYLYLSTNDIMKSNKWFMKKLHEVKWSLRSFGAV